MPEIIVLTPREQSVWDAVYGAAYVVYQDALRAIVIADSSVLDLRKFENDHPERGLPATQVFK